MKITTNGYPEQKFCESEWEENGNYAFISFDIPYNGTASLVPQATLTGTGSQGLTWVFTADEPEHSFELTTYDSYYQDFLEGEPGSASFFSMWETAHALEFECPGVLTVRKYNYFTENESLCLYFTRGLIDETEK